MDVLTSGRSGIGYRVGEPVVGLDDGFYRGAGGGRDVLLRVVANGTPATTTLRGEAALLDQLDHPRIARLLDRGRTTHYHFLALDAQGDQPLADIISTTDLSPAAALGIVAQVSDVLVALHQAGVVWGRLRPHAFTVNKSGQLKLVDVRGAGLALHEAPERSDVVYNVATLGDATYLAPEIGLEQTPTASGDIYACGVLLYELLAGQPPFTGATPAEVVMKHLSAPAPDLAALRPGLPPEVAGLVERCLAKTPADRPASAAELHAQLVALRDQLADEEEARLITCPRCQGRVFPAERCPLCNAPLAVAPGPVEQRKRRWLPLAAIAGSIIAMLAMLLNVAGKSGRVVVETLYTTSLPPTATVVAAAPAATPRPTREPTPVPTGAAIPTPRGAIAMPANDVNDPNIDLIKASVEITSEVVAELDVVGRVAAQGDTRTYQIFIDTDGPAAGDTSTPWQELAADYAVLYRTGDESAMALRWNGTAWQGVGAASTTLNGGRLIVSVPLAWLGNPPSLRYGIVTTNPGANLADYAPARQQPPARVTKDGE